MSSNLWGCAWGTRPTVLLGGHLDGDGHEPAKAAHRPVIPLDRSPPVRLCISARPSALRERRWALCGTEFGRERPHGRHWRFQEAASAVRRRKASRLKPRKSRCDRRAGVPPRHWASLQPQSHYLRADSEADLYECLGQLPCPEAGAKCSGGAH